MRLEEGGQVAGDRRVGLVGQTQLAETGDRPAGRTVRHLALREEAVQEQAADARAIDFDRHRAADHAAAAAEDRDGILFDAFRPAGQQGFLGRAAGMPQGDRLPRIELDALFGEAAGDEMGQGEVHVVAADQQMVADGQPLQDQFALLLGHADQRQVGGAAADVADQQRIAQREALPPALAAIGQPGIDGRLRLFQQHEVLGQAGGQRGLAGQLPRAGVERRRHGQHDDLPGRGACGKRRFPRGDQVFQVALRSGHGRNLRHVGRRPPRQERLVAVHAAIGQPQLGRPHGPLRHLGAVPPGEFADGEVAPLGPGQVQRPAARLVRAGQVRERRQHGPRLDRAGRDQLRKRQHLDPRLRRLQRRVAEHAVGGAKIDSKNVLGGHNSTSTGATTRAAAAVPDQAGS